MIDHKKLALTTNDPFGGNLQALLFVGEQIARVADALEKTPERAQSYSEIRVNDVKAAEEALSGDDSLATQVRRLHAAEAAYEDALRAGSKLDRKETFTRLQEAQKAYVDNLGEFGKSGR